MSLPSWIPWKQVDSKIILIFTTPNLAISRCEDWCDEGYYGEGCNQACECPSTNYLCHPVLGCICQPRYSGPNCSTPAPISAVWPYTDLVLTDTGSEASLYVGLIVACLLIVAVVGVLVTFWQKRKFRQLKTRRENAYNSEQRGKIWHTDKT